MLIIDMGFIFDDVEYFCLFYSFNELFFQIVVVNVLFFIGFGIEIFGDWLCMFYVDFTVFFMVFIASLLFD